MYKIVASRVERALKKSTKTHRLGPTKFDRVLPKRVKT
jgi:hypothetical protein